MKNAVASDLILDIQILESSRLGKVVWSLFHWSEDICVRECNPNVVVLTLLQLRRLRDFALVRKEWLILSNLKEFNVSRGRFLFMWLCTKVMLRTFTWLSRRTNLWVTFHFPTVGERAFKSHSYVFDVHVIEAVYLAVKLGSFTLVIHTEA